MILNELYKKNHKFVEAQIKILQKPYDLTVEGQ